MYKTIKIPSAQKVTTLPHGCHSSSSLRYLLAQFFIVFKHLIKIQIVEKRKLLLF